MGKYVIVDIGKKMMVQHVNQEEANVAWTRAFDGAKGYDAAWQAEYEKDWIAYYITGLSSLEVHYIDSQMQFDRDYPDESQGSGTFLSTGDIPAKGKPYDITPDGTLVQTMVPDAQAPAVDMERLLADVRAIVGEMLDERLEDRPGYSDIIPIIRSEIQTRLQTLNLTLSNGQMSLSSINDYGYSHNHGEIPLHEEIRRVSQQQN